MTALPSRSAAALALIAAGLLLVGLGAPASAHNSLVSVTPADGSTVEVAPATVDLVFDEPAITLGTEVLVTGPDGKSVSNGAPVLVDATVRQSLTAVRPAGAYTVQWRVTSADGHPISGRLTFTSTSAVGAPAATSTAPGPSPTSSAGPTTSSPATPSAGGSDAAGEVDAGFVVGPGVIAAGAAVLLALTAAAIWWIRRRPS